MSDQKKRPLYDPPYKHQIDDTWAKFMLVLTTDNQIWVRVGKHIWKVRLSRGHRPST